MRRHRTLAACVATTLVCLCAVFTANAADDAHERISRMLANAETAAAEKLADAELLRARTAKGNDSSEAAYWYNEKGIIAQARGHYAEALDWFSQALQIRRRRLGMRHADTITALNNVAVMEEQTGRYREALSHLQLAYRLNNATPGRGKRLSLATLSNIGLLNLSLGHIDLARTQLQSVLDETAMSEGWWARNTATALSNLASVDVTGFRFNDAERLLKRALAIDEYRHGPSHPEVAITLNNLGELYRLQGRPVEAEQAYLRAAAIDRAFLGAGSPGYAIDLLNLAALYGQTGRLNDARATLDSAMPVIAGQIPGHVEANAAALSELAHLLCSQGRCEQARPLLERASGQVSKAFGTTSAASLQIWDDQAMLHATLGDHAAAARDRRSHLSAAEAAFGPGSPVVVRARLRWAQALAAANNIREAEKALVGLQPLVDKHFGRRSLDAAHLWALRARLSLANRKWRDAQHDARRSLQLFRAWLSANALQLAQGHAVLASVHLRQQHWRQALVEAQRALRIIGERRRLAASRLRDGQIGIADDDSEIAQIIVASAIDASHHIRARADALNTALDAAELMADQARDRAVTYGALKRRALQTGTLPLVHRQALLLEGMASLDTAVVHAMTSGANLPAVKARRSEILSGLEQIRDELQRALPADADLLDHRRIRPHEIRQRLNEGEVLLYLMPADDRTAVLAITKTAMAGHMAPLPRGELSGMVDRLRSGLDPTRWKSTFEPFDRTEAHRLYTHLIKPLEHLLRGSRTMFVASAAPLDDLPLAVLVETPPDDGTAGDSAPEALRATAWLGRRLGIVQVPSASALYRLRRPDSSRDTPASFLGVGSRQVLKGSGSTALPALAAAEPEIQTIASTMGRDRSTLLLGREATKSALRLASPARKSVIAFATHALTSQQSGVGEPALALSLNNPRARTDGLLTASEIASMDLAADWVILSGCNTAGEETAAVVSLAQAFTLAGAKSLLVSHWPVLDGAAARMTTSVMRNYRAHPQEGQAEALRRSMIDTMEDQAHPLNAHPSTWAAFSLMGEARSPGPAR